MDDMLSMNYTLYKADWAIATNVPDEQNLSPMCIYPRIVGTGVVFDVVQSIFAGRYRFDRVPTWIARPVDAWKESPQVNGDVEVHVTVDGLDEQQTLLFTLKVFSDLVFVCDILERNAKDAR
jgi:hypothetical protein